MELIYYKDKTTGQCWKYGHCFSLYTGIYTYAKLKIEKDLFIRQDRTIHFEAITYIRAYSDCQNT